MGKPPSQLQFCPTSSIKSNTREASADDLIGQHRDPRAVETEPGEVHQNVGQRGAHNSDGEQGDNRHKPRIARAAESSAEHHLLDLEQEDHGDQEHNVRALPQHVGVVGEPIDDPVSKDRHERAEDGGEAQPDALRHFPEHQRAIGAFHPETLPDQRRRRDRQPVPDGERQVQDRHTDLMRREIERPEPRDEFGEGKEPDPEKQLLEQRPAHHEKDGTDRLAVDLEEP